MDEAAFLRLLSGKRAWQPRSLFCDAAAEQASVLKQADRLLRIRERLAKVFRDWAGPELAAASRVIGYLDGVLEVGAADSAAYAELHRRKEGLLHALRRGVHCPLTTVRIALGEVHDEDRDDADADPRRESERG